MLLASQHPHAAPETEGDPSLGLVLGVGSVTCWPHWPDSQFHLECPPQGVARNTRGNPAVSAQSTAACPPGPLPLVSLAPPPAKDVSGLFPLKKVPRKRASSVCSQLNPSTESRASHWTLNRYVFSPWINEDSPSSLPFLSSSRTLGCRQASGAIMASVVG